MPESSYKAETVGQKTYISVKFHTVSISIDCTDCYEARVLCDDLISRIRSGEGVCVTVRKDSTKI